MKDRQEVRIGKYQERQILIVGCGIGDRRYLTRQGAAALRTADLFIGTPSLLRRMSDQLGAGRREYAESAAEVRRAIDRAPEQRIAVLMEGDAGMDAPGSEYTSLLDLRPGLIPGISIQSYISARTGIPYGDAVTVDLRKRWASLLPALETHRKVIVYGNERMRGFFREIIEAGYIGTAVYAVENPGETSERVWRGTVSDASVKGFSANTIYFFLRGGKPRRGVLGISSELFLPNPGMLPREVRAAALTHLEIGVKDIVYCVGSGCGEMVIETALLASEGMVYAIEKESSKVEATITNAQRFGIRNLAVINGEAPEALAHLPAPDAAWISCESEIFKDLFQILVSRNPAIRITVSTGDMAAAVRACDLLEGMNFETEESEIRVSERIKNGGTHCLRSQNPVYIISGRKKSGHDHG